MKGFVKSPSPYIVPSYDDRKIEEYIGLAATGDHSLSLARVFTPGQWTDCYQKADFDEVIFMMNGTQLIKTDDEIVELKAGQSFLIKKGTRVQYSNPSQETNEYWSLCIPAYTVETVNREEDMFFP